MTDRPIPFSPDMMRAVLREIAAPGTGKTQTRRIPKLRGYAGFFQFGRSDTPGHERLSKDGYIEVSVDQVNPHTGYHRRYVQKHRWLWEQANGPVPDGMCLKCLDGDKTNCDPTNWKAIPRALLPRLNGRFGRDYDSAPPELKPLILKTAELEHSARETRKPT